MKLWGYDEVTSHSLGFLKSFPVLALYDVWNCGFGSDADIRARQVGWTAVRFRDALQFLDEKCLERFSPNITEILDAKTVGTAYSQPLWDASSVRRIPRAEVSAFLIDKIHQTYDAASGLKTRAPKALKSERNSHHIRKEQRSARKDKTPQIKPPETWDYRTYSSFARIGELLNDSDLEEAGIAIESQAVVANQLVNSVPFVSLCVGPTQPITSMLKFDALAFVRIRIPGNEEEELNFDEKIPVSRTQKRAYVPKQPSHGVNKTRKRNLDDVLSSFM